MVKVLFAGTPDVAVPALRALAGDAEHFEVVAVLTRPDAPTGRGRRLMPSPVKQAAMELGLPVIESDPGEETFIAELAATGAEAAAVVAYGRLLKQDVLDALQKYCGETKKHMTALTEQELDVVFESFTQSHEVREAYMQVVGSKNPPVKMDAENVVYLGKTAATAKKKQVQITHGDDRLILTFEGCAFKK